MRNPPMSSGTRSAENQPVTVNVKMLQQISNYMDGWTDRMCKRVDELLQNHPQSAACKEVNPPEEDDQMPIALTA